MRFHGRIGVSQGVLGPDPVAAPATVPDELLVRLPERASPRSDDAPSRVMISLEGQDSIGLRLGAAGTFPTGLVGGETIEIDIDGAGDVLITFGANETLAAVVIVINTALGFAAASDVGGELQISSLTRGPSSSVALTDTTPGTLAVLGHTVGTTSGVTSTVTVDLWALDQGPVLPSGESPPKADRQFHRFATALVVNSQSLQGITAGIPPGGPVYAQVTATTLDAASTLLLGVA